MKASKLVLVACLGLAHCGGGGASDAGSASAATPAIAAAVAIAVPPQGSAKVLCSPPPAPAAPPGDYPPRVVAPATPLAAMTATGFGNWSAGYQLQSMVYHLLVLRDPAWVPGLIDSAESMLARRDAIGRDGQPYAWLDRSSDVTAPYAWLAYAAHTFAPLMQFARAVAADASLAACTYQGRTLREYAARYLAEFDRLLLERAPELVRAGGESHHVFDSVPSVGTVLAGLPLPVNMDADVFLAMLHSIPVEQALGSPELADERKALVQEHVNRLVKRVLRLESCGSGRACLRWNYATYLQRAEDVGHANVVAKFLLDAYDDGYGVPVTYLVAFANTMDNLVDDAGQFRGNLLDGRTAVGVVHPVYYEILYGRFSPTLRAKVRTLVMASGNFTYAGPWLQLSASP